MRPPYLCSGTRASHNIVSGQLMDVCENNWAKTRANAQKNITFVRFFKLEFFSAGRKTKNGNNKHVFNSEN